VQRGCPGRWCGQWLWGRVGELWWKQLLPGPFLTVRQVFCPPPSLASPHCSRSPIAPTPPLKKLLLLLCCALGASGVCASFEFHSVVAAACPPSFFLWKGFQCVSRQPPFSVRGVVGWPLLVCVVWGGVWLAVPPCCPHDAPAGLGHVCVPRPLGRCVLRCHTFWWSSFFGLPVNGNFPFAWSRKKCPVLSKQHTQSSNEAQAAHSGHMRRKKKGGGGV
jgi:hypothetical protein